MSGNEPAPDTSAMKGRHRALALLRILLRSDLQGRGNEYFLSAALHGLALGGSREAVRACLQKLEDRGLITSSPAPDRDLLILELTADGVAVAEGKSRADGVEPFVVGCHY